MVNKRGLSAVVTAVIMIALVFSLVAIVWVIVDKMVSDELGGAESCFAVFGEVAVNSIYTCYDSIEGEFQFSISIGDLNVDEVIVAVSGGGTKKSFKITNDTSTIENLRNYPGGSVEVKLPEKNGASTYVYDMVSSGFSDGPDLIEIVPIINGEQCEISDSLSDIDDCLLLP